MSQAALLEFDWPLPRGVRAAFTTRLGAQGPRWKVMGINYYHSTRVSWPTGS